MKLALPFSLCLLLACFAAPQHAFSQCTADFTFSPDSVCANVPIQFTAVTTGNPATATYTWNFGAPGANPTGVTASHVFGNECTGTLTLPVTLTVVYVDPDPMLSCSVTVAKSVNVKCLPDPHFKIADSLFCNKTLPDTIHLVNLSNTQGSNPSYSIFWDNGQPAQPVGAFDTLTQIYQQEGYRYVSISVTNALGCSNTETHAYYAGKSPAVGIGVGPHENRDCAPVTVFIKINDYSANTIGTTYVIDFGDDTDTTFQHPPPDSTSHTFLTSSCGEEGDRFTVNLQAINGCDVSEAELPKLMGVSTPPTASVKITPPSNGNCVGNTFNFCDDSFGQNTYLSSTQGCTDDLDFFNWAISPPNFTIVTGGLNQECVSVKFTQTGTYAITFTTGTECGDDDTTVFVQVVPMPEAGFSIVPQVPGGNNCVPFVVTFDNSSMHQTGNQWTLVPGSANGVNWEFINGTSATSENPQVRFNKPGKYDVSLTVSNVCGSDTYAQQDYVVAGLPTLALAQITPICNAGTVTPAFSGTPNPNCSPITAWLWTAPGGVISNPTGSTPPGIFFDTCGSFPISVTATNGCGTSVPVSVNATVTCPGQVEINAPDSLCQGDDCVTLTASQNGGTWSCAAMANGQFCPSAAGIFEVCYSVGPSLCPATDKDTIVVSPLPPLSLPTDTAVCEGSPAFPLTASQPGCLWTGVGVDACGTFNPTTPGVFTLEFCFADPVTGCVHCKTMQVTVVALPRFDLPDTTLICTSTDLLVLEDLLDVPPPGGVTSEWKQLTPCAFLTLLDPANGTVNTSGTTGDCTFEVTHVRLPGCAWKDTVTITFIEKTQADAGEDLRICIAQNFTMPPATPLDGKWLKISGAGHISISEDGLVSVSGSSGGICVFEYVFQENTSCETRDQVQVEVVSLSVPPQPDLHVCETASFLVLGSLPANHEWLVGQPSPPGVTFTTVNGEWRVNFPTGIPASYSLIYRVIDPGIANCEVSEQVTLHVHRQPEVSYAVPANLCEDEPVTFTSTLVSDDPVQYLWDFDGACPGSNFASPTCTFSEEGNYDVSVTVRTLHPLTGALLCENVFSQTVHVSEPPVALFTASTQEGCAPLKVDFTNGSLGENLSFHWDFGAAANPPTWDGATPPQVVFPNAATIVTYPVTLTVTNPCGSRTHQLSITVKPLPAPHFGFDFEEYCSGDTIEIGYDGVGMPTSFEWWLDGVLTWTVQDPPPFFIEVGDLAVWHFLQLTTKNDCGDSTYFDSVLIRPTDVKAFIHANKNTLCQGDTLKLTSFSTPGAPLDWDIFRADGSLFLTGNSESLNIQFSEPGTYKIVLRAFGCGFDGDTLVVSVNPLPVVNFSCGDCRECQDIPLNFNPLPPLVSQYAWDFGDSGGGSMETFPAHAFGSDGTFTVVLTGTDENGCSATDQVEVTIDTLPVAAFAADLEVCEGDLVSFTNLSQTPVACEWSHPALASGGCNPGAVFSEAGTFPITLTVTDLQGCKGEQMQWLQVADAPTASFTAGFSGDCTPVSATFTNQSLDGTDFQWFVNGQLMGATTNFSYVFTQGGSFEVKLVAIHAGFCADTTSQNFTIQGTPTADFLPKNAAGCAPFEVQFDNKSSPLGSLNFVWTLDGDTFSYAANPALTLDSAGIFEVCLTSKTFVCEAKSCDTVIVFPQVTAGFEVDTILCKGEQTGCISTTVTGGTLPFVFNWSNGESGPVLCDLFAGNYGVTVSDPNGCTFAAEVGVPEPEVALAHQILHEKIVTCFGGDDGELTAWGAGGTPPYSISWQGGGSDSAQVDLVAGSYFFTLTDANGCTHAAEIELAQNPKLEIEDSLKHLTCFGDDDGLVELTALTGGVPLHVVTLTGNGTTRTGLRFGELEPGGYDLLVVDAVGCELTAHYEVIEPMKIGVDIFPHKSPNDTTTKLGEPLQLVTSHNAMQATIAWMSDSLVDCPGCLSPFANLVEPATLMIFLTDFYGCTVSDTVRISVEKVRDVAFPNAFSPNSDGFNDVFFALTGNPAVTEVKLLQVFSQGGELFFEAKNAPPNSALFGWDGTWKGKPAQVGAYAWQAEITYLDGVTLPFKGIVRLIR